MIFYVKQYFCSFFSESDRRLPVPEAITTMFDGRLYHPMPNNDPGLHQGRERLFEHERGNWATYVYVPCEL